MFSWGNLVCKSSIWAEIPLWWNCIDSTSGREPAVASPYKWSLVTKTWFLQVRSSRPSDEKESWLPQEMLWLCG